MNKRSEKDRISAVLFIVVFLLVVVIVIMVLKTLDDKKAADQAEEAQASTQGYQPPVIDPNGNNIAVADPSATPNPYAPVNALPTTAPTTAPATNQTPAATQAPVATQAPAPTTAPTQAPAATQAPAPTQAPGYSSVALGSGSFESDTKTPLNIRAEWSAKTVNDSQVEVTVTVFCLHQTLYTGEYNPVNIMLDGQYATLYAKKIESDSYDLQRTEVASRTFTIDLAQGSSKSFWLNVEWEYGGSYSGVQLDTIECGGNITLNR